MLYGSTNRPLFKCKLSPKGVSGKPYPLANYIMCSNFSYAHRYYQVVITKVVEPRFFHEAVKDSK